MGVQASRYNRIRRRDARSGCIGSVLDYHATEDRPAFHDEPLGPRGSGGRMPRLIGKARALEMFVAAERVSAAHALRIGLVDAVADDPVEEALRRLRR